jgi:Tol biopolymer transport system component
MGLLLLATAGLAAQNRPLKSELCIYDLGTSSSRCILSTTDHLEAPNWTPDGKHLIVNSGGLLFEVDLANPVLKQIPTGEVSSVNNDHGVSPDGNTLVISAGHMYTLPRTGGIPKQITQHRPSYYHGWSPDGKTLAMCAHRGDNNYDIYVIPVTGGEEHRITVHPGHDDGPDYSPDGKWIYFNSDRGGSAEIWRMPAGKKTPQDEYAELVVRGPRVEWFPHPSPDGKLLVYLSYPEGTKGHPPNKAVELRLIRLDAGDPIAQTPKVLERFTGGQGTINVNSWAPDSQRFAYVRYTYPAP